jgi:hypothetical protein
MLANLLDFLISSLQPPTFHSARCFFSTFPTYLLLLLLLSPLASYLPEVYLAQTAAPGHTPQHMLIPISTLIKKATMLMIWYCKPLWSRKVEWSTVLNGDRVFDSLLRIFLKYGVGNLQLLASIYCTDCVGPELPLSISLLLTVHCVLTIVRVDGAMRSAVQVFFWKVKSNWKLLRSPYSRASGFTKYLILGLKAPHPRSPPLAKETQILFHPVTSQSLNMPR